MRAILSGVIALMGLAFLAGCTRSPNEPGSGAGEPQAEIPATAGESSTPSPAASPATDMAVDEEDESGERQETRTGGSATRARFRFDRDVGSATTTKDGQACLTVPNASVGAGTRVALVWVAAIPAQEDLADESWRSYLERPENRLPHVWIAEVSSPRNTACEKDEAQEGDHHYNASIVQRDAGTDKTSWIAIVDPPPVMRLDDAAVESDMDGDGVPEFFRVCSGGSGLHSAIWSGAGARVTRRWHRYDDFGEEVNASCDDIDHDGKQ